MSNHPRRLKRAVEQPRIKARIISATPLGQKPRALPNADTFTAQAKRDPLAGHGLATALGVSRKSETRTIKFERAPVSVDLSMFQMKMGVKKAPSFVVGYVRADAPTDAVFTQRFADAGCHELRREGRQGRNILAAILNSITKGDVLQLDKLSDLALAKDLPSVIKRIEDHGVTIRSFDGADSSTAKGQAKIAKTILAAKELFGGAARF